MAVEHVTKCDRDEQRGVVVTSLGASTKLLYVGPG